MNIEVSETSAVIVLDQTDTESKFKLLLPGRMTYDEAPANAKMAAVICALLRKDDPEFKKYLLKVGREEYGQFFRS